MFHVKEQKTAPQHNDSICAVMPGKETKRPSEEAAAPKTKQADQDTENSDVNPFSIDQDRHLDDAIVSQIAERLNYRDSEVRDILMQDLRHFQNCGRQASTSFVGNLYMRMKEERKAKEAQNNAYTDAPGSDSKSPLSDGSQLGNSQRMQQLLLKSALS